MSEATREPLGADDASAFDTIEFDEAYREHAPALLNYARRLTSSSAQAEDWVAEAFLRTIAATRRGNGPTSDIRGYLFAAVRSVRAEAYRAPVTYLPRPDMPENHPELVIEDQSDALVDASVAASAFATLPARWQQVLQLTTVEDGRVEDAAEELGISSGAATVLAFRAREGLRTAYLQEWVPRAERPECITPRPLLARWVRDALPEAQAKMVATHVDECEDCATTVLALRGEATRMRTLPLWLLVPALPLGATKAGVGAATVAAQLGQDAARTISKKWAWAGGSATACALSLTVAVLPINPMPGAATPPRAGTVASGPQVRMTSAAAADHAAQLPSTAVTATTPARGTLTASSRPASATRPATTPHRPRPAVPAATPGKKAPVTPARPVVKPKPKPKPINTAKPAKPVPQPQPTPVTPPSTTRSGGILTITLCWCHPWAHGRHLGHLVLVDCNHVHVHGHGQGHASAQTHGKHAQGKSAQQAQDKDKGKHGKAGKHDKGRGAQHH